MISLPKAAFLSGDEPTRAAVAGFAAGGTGLAPSARTRTPAARKNRAGLRRRLKDESGSVTVEYVIWLPLIIGLALLLFEATVVFMTQATHWRVANHASRAVTTGQMTMAEAKTMVQNTHNQTITFVPSQGVLHAVISTPYNEIGLGMLAPLGSMTVTLFQRIEPHVNL